MVILRQAQENHGRDQVRVRPPLGGVTDLGPDRRSSFDKLRMSGYLFPLMVILRQAQENHGRDQVRVRPPLGASLTARRTLRSMRAMVDHRPAMLEERVAGGRPLDRARAIGDRFVAWQGPAGRPDPERCPWVSQAPFYLPVNGHAPPVMARALYLLFAHTADERYKHAADRYAIFTFGYPRNPVAPWDDRLRNTRVEHRLLDSPEERFNPRGANQHSSRSWLYGSALDPGLREFRRFNPDDDCFDAVGDALFDWLQWHRVDRGQAYNIGYPPGNASDASITDAAYTDDLRQAGGGLVGYYELSRRPEVLDAAVRLADFFLRPHQEGSPDGAFLEALGTWCICPWPIVARIEHFSDVRLDQAGWGFSARGCVEFLTRLHALLPADHPRAVLMRERCTRSVRWQLGCQFPNDALGMHGQDDEWLGMAAAVVLAYDDIRRAEWVDADTRQEFEPRVRAAAEWLIANATDEFIDQGGYRRVTGRSTPWPPENTLWLLAWTVEALVRLEVGA
jgi:hypothetical protein